MHYAAIYRVSFRIKNLHFVQASRGIRYKSALTYKATSYIGMQMQSFIDVPHGSDFPLENLPWGVFSTSDNPTKHIGAALGSYVVDVTELQKEGLMSGPLMSDKQAQNCFSKGSLNAFMGLGQPYWSEARSILQRLLSKEEGVLRDDASLRKRAFKSQAEVTMHLPADIGDYTDFYASYHHAFNVGALFRGPGNELQPNWLHLPVGYHGRSSSIVVSGVDVRRPRGQVNTAAPTAAPAPTLKPCNALDFELELAAFIGPGNSMGEPITMANASDHIFGYVLMNDWSARDIQKWEYVPLGPFNGKNWATQISPWIVTLDALQAFTTSPPKQDPAPLPYLTHPSQPHVTHDINLSVDIIPSGASQPARVTTTNLKYMYWTFPQMVAHHTVGGCNMRPGDLLGSGTLSGPEPGQQACLLELTQGGKKSVALSSSNAGSHDDGTVERTYLLDGDEVILRGWCEKEGLPYRIGFGECRGKLLPCSTKAC